MADNIDNFNAVVGLIFDQLYRAFPMVRDIDVDAIAQSLGYGEPIPNMGSAGGVAGYDHGSLENGTKVYHFVEAAADWLTSEGFIRGGQYNKLENVRLTAKAFAALNASPESLEKPLGSRLAGAAKSAGTEAGRAAIGETVGQIIAAFTKSLLN